MVATIRRNGKKGLDSKFTNSIASGNFAKVAYVDPNDPSVIYLEQPEIPQTNTNQNIQQEK